MIKSDGMESGKIESYLTTVLSIDRNELPLMAAKPPTNAPTNAVTKISNTEDPPKGNICAILCESTLLFLTSIQSARMPHNKKTPRKPERKAIPYRCLISKATRKDMMAILHQGANNPAIKLNVAVNKVANINLI
jgi:hypothetical protein